MTNKDVVRKFFQDGYVAFNSESLLTLISENYIDHSPCQARGNQACISILQGTAACFSNMQVEIQDLIEENNKVAVRAVFSCKHTGKAFDLEPTFKDIKFEALEIFRIENGQIVESWGYWPDAQIKAQLAPQTD